MSFKFRKLIGPVSAASALLVLVYSLFDWFLVAGTGWLPLDKSLTDLVLPVVFAAALLMTFVRRHIRALALSEEWSLPLVYLFVAGLTIAVPTIASAMTSSRRTARTIEPVGERRPISPARALSPVR